MGASIEKSLYIGILKTRFDLYDDVKLQLRDGAVISGTIVDFQEEHIVWLDNKDGRVAVYVDDIEDDIS